MSLESSHEHTEQEQPRSAMAAETDHSPYELLLQEGDEAESASNDLEELENELIAWLQTPDWNASQTYLQAHPHLLTERAEQVLEQLKHAQLEGEVRSLMSHRQTLLHQARTWEIAGVYAYVQLAEQAATIGDHESETLLRQLEGWLATPGWEQKQVYLEEHPDLLTKAAESLLAVWWLSTETPQSQVFIALHLQLLQRACAYGITAAYRWLPGPASLNNAGREAINEYLANGGTEVLEQTLECWQQALFLTLPDSPDRAMYLSNLGNGLQEHYGRTGALDDLERAIVLYQQAVDATPPDSPDWPGYLNNLGNGLQERYRRAGVLDDLERAIVLYQQAVDATPPDSPDWPVYLTNLGLGLHNRYERTGVLDDLERAISVLQQAVDVTPPNSPNRAMYLSNLGLGLHNRYVRTGVLDDLERVIAVFQQAVDVTPPNSPSRCTYLNNLGLGLHNRYERTGVLDDLERAISVLQQAVDATPSNSPNRAMYLSNLGNGLRDRYGRTGVLDDLERAIVLYQQAVDATPPNSPDRPGYLTSLGNGLRDRYGRTGVLDDLERAIVLYQQAVDATPPNSPDRPGYLNNLGNGLRDRYERTGVLDDLERAITVYQQAVDATPPHSSNRAMYLSNLGRGLRDRYVRTGMLDDLERAISVLQQAVDVTPSDSPDRAGYLTNLGGGLHNRYERTGMLDDLERAISVLQQAVDATPPNSPSRCTYLNNLGLGLYDRYRHTGVLDDLERAITVYQQAVDATPPHFPNRAMYLSNLGLGLHNRYMRTGMLDDLERAITVYQQAVDATPSNSPNRTMYLSNLGNGLQDHYARTGASGDLEKVITTWETNWSLLHLRFVALPVAYQLGQQRQGVHIAASLVTAYLERSARHHPNARIDCCRALEVVEGSKSRLLTQLVGRGPLPLPLGLSPEIAAREQHLLSDLTTLDTLELAIHDQPTPAQQEAGSLHRLQQRQADLIELEDLWDDIARLGSEGMEYVALRRGEAQTWQDLTHLAKKLGPNTALLSFFTTPDRVLLFLLRAGWRMPRVVEASLNQTGWDDLLERFFREVHRYEPGLHRSETWDQPLRSLFTKAQHHLEGVERLILAPAGNGHLLPWGVLAERAGWHTSAGQPLPLVTLPALGILPRLRQRQHVPTGPALVIGNPRGDLPYAEVEANAVAERFGTKPLLGAAAATSAVLTRLPDATLIHLATHAFFDADNPLESGIVLADGVLTAQEVLQYRLQADLLVLSACESGQVGSLGGEELAGLSQAFLQTGVRSLLVSLWQVNDPATAALMQAFYTARQAGADKALALRQAMTQLQQDPRWTHPYYWGAFVLEGDWE